jgi:hypothetical protein
MTEDRISGTKVEWNAEGGKERESQRILAIWCVKKHDYEDSYQGMFF